MEVRSCDKCRMVFPIEHERKDIHNTIRGPIKDAGQRVFTINTETGMVQHTGDYCKGCCREFDDLLKPFFKPTT